MLEWYTKKILCYYVIEIIKQKTEKGYKRENKSNLMHETKCCLLTWIGGKKNSNSRSKYTVLQKYRHTRNFPETRVIIKILKNPCYPT